MYGRAFTKKEDDFIRKHCLTIPAKRIAAMLGRSEGTARQRMKVLGIVVPPEVIARFKQESRFKKGHVPMNKGKRWKTYMKRPAIEACKKTQFKKGCVPPNRKPVGYERVNVEGYIEVKVGEGMRQFRLKQRVIYEQHFGPIPKGYLVAFADGNNRNFEPSNLMLRTRQENMRLNTYHNYPKDIANTIQLIGALHRQINKRKKLLHEKQNNRPAQPSL